MQHRNHINNGLIFICCLIIVAIACQKENKNYTATISVLNAIPDATGVDIYIAGSKLNATTAYGVGDYKLPVIATTDSVKWRLTGGADFDSAFVTDLPSGSDFSVLFFDSASKYKTYFFKENWPSASTTQAHIRFLSMLSGADSLVVTNDTLLGLSGVRSFADFNGSSSAVAFNAIDTIATKLRLMDNFVQLDSMTVSLRPGGVYSLYILGILGNTGDRKPKMVLYKHE